eukprot:jgi/Orpsp1_1/1188663/evm.model.d7180000066364.1
MNKQIILLFLLITIFYYIIPIYAENENYIVAIRRDKTDKNFDHESLENQREIGELVNERMNDIYDIIVDNKDTYILENGKMDEKLEEIENTNSMRKRSFKKTKLLFVNTRRGNYDNDHRDFAKRSLDLIQQNNSTEEYIPIESKLVTIFDQPLTLERSIQDQSVNNKNSNSKNDNSNSNSKSTKVKSKSNLFYDIKAIKNETNWSDVSVQTVTFNSDHLSIISQSPTTDMNKPFDNTYYYPSSAGKGVDIYFVDTGLNADHVDFDTSERTVSCDAIATDYGTYVTSGEEKIHCAGDDDYPSHGVMVASLAGGSIYGVAKKANLHVIATYLSVSSCISAYDFILRNAKNPHRTIISVSLGGELYSQAEDNILGDLIKAGFTIFGCAGNKNKNCCSGKESDQFVGLPGFRKVIAVGAIDGKIYGDGYYRASYSNYGDCVDIFGPGFGTSAGGSNGSRDSTQGASGTSSATPIVAGVAALIMSEHPNVQYNIEKMRKAIIELSVKDAIHDLVSSDTPNRFVNNGKRSIYRKSDSISTPCGKGYDKCTDGCCTKEDVIKECEKEYDDNKECFISISSNSDDSTIMDQCKILESNKCKEYFKKRINNLSYCTIAKDYKSFSSIYNKFNEKWYHNTVKECRQRMDEYIDQCNTEMNTDNLKDCFISDNINFNDPYNFASTASFCNNLKQQKCISLYDENGDSMK